jgi:uncharacterized membrane protein
MKWTLRQEIVPLCVLALFGILTATYYPALPENIPTHFNMEGKPDQYQEKLTAVSLIFGLLVALYALLTFLPRIDPFWKRIQPKYNLLLLLRDFVLMLMVFVYVLTLVASREGKLRLDLMGIGLGFFFVLMGNYLPRLPRNWFFGIRVPWTLSSEVVWRRTHIVGGRWFVGAGFVMIILSLLKVNQPVALGIPLLPTVIYTGFIYPFFLYRKLQREGKLNEVAS